MTGSEVREEIRERSLPRQVTQPAWDLARAVAIIGIATAVALLLRPHAAPTNLAMVYLLGVVAISLCCRRSISVFASFLSVAAFDFFCIPPYLNFRVSDYQYLITFSGMLVVALVINTQTLRIRTHAADAERREVRIETLYRLSRRLAGQNRVFDVARTAAEFAEEVLPGNRVVIFLPEEGAISFKRRSSDHLPLPAAEEAKAQSSFTNGEKKTGVGSLYIPLKGTKSVVGVMGVLAAPGAVLEEQQIQLLELFADQAALAIERTNSQHTAEDARVRMHTEAMRSSLLSAVSHDLRTPLASITGAASTLRSQGERLEPEVRADLLQSIGDEAQRLSRLVGNLLDMTRLESGVELRRDCCPLEEIVGAALQRIEGQLEKRQITTHLPDNLPPVYVDDVLLGQVVMNLVENAVKYTPEGTAIELAAEATEGEVVLEVRDRGPGLEQGDEHRIFEKFYRRKAAGVGGSGLGLAICRAIVEAHRGTIEAFNRDGGGAVFRVHLPLEQTG